MNERLIPGLIILSLSLLLMSPNGHAQGHSRVRKKRVNVASSDLQSEASIGYRIATDRAQPQRPALIRNNIDFGYSHPVRKMLRLSIESGVFYDTIDKNVVREHEEAQTVGLEDVRVSASLPIHFSIHSLKIFGGHIIPASEEARYEGYKGIPFLGVGTTSRFFKGRYAVTNSLVASHIVNTYRYSPVSDQINPDSSLTYTLGNRIQLFPRFWLAIEGGIKATRYLDQSGTVNFGNAIGVSYAYNDFALSLSYRNSNYADYNEVNLWFIDRYRQLIQASLGYTF